MPSPPSSSFPAGVGPHVFLYLGPRDVPVSRTNEAKFTFTGPGRVVTGGSTELVIPDIAAARCEVGVFGIRVRVAKVFTEGLGCDTGRYEIDLIVAVGIRVLMLSPFIRRTIHDCFP